MSDLRAAIEALATEYEVGLGSYVVAESTVAAELRAILAECEEEDIGDATLPLMPTSKRTVTLREEPAPMFAGDPSGGGSNLPAPKRWTWVCENCGTPCPSCAISEETP